MMIHEMDLIKEEGEIIPDSVLDLILEVSERPYAELGDEVTENIPNLADSIHELVSEICKYEEGYGVILLTGIFLGQCVMPTIRLHNPNNKLPFVILNLVCGYYFNYMGVNNEYARDKIVCPPLKKEIRDKLFTEENNLESINVVSSPTYYINGLKFYYHLLSLSISEDIVEEVSELFRLCIGENTLSDELFTRKQILHWIVIENISTIWKGKLPSNAFDKENLWHPTTTKLF